MNGAIVAASSGWAGIGFAAQPGQMLDADAITVKPCSDCSTGVATS